jgi:DNA-binding IclR family transcriptional regulator
LARQWLRHNPFSDLAQPVLDDMSRTFNVTGLGVQIAGLDHIIVAAVSRSVTDFQFNAEIGSRFPALISATGRCIAAFADYSDAEIENRFQSLRWDEPPAFDEWKAQVRQTKARGFAIDEGNYISGVTVVAAPVWARRAKLSHALVAIGISSTLKRNGIGKLQTALLSAAQTLTKQLGGD